MTLHDLKKYRKNVYSQNGEDGVIAEICSRWKLTSGWFCEFGAWDGKYGSNCYSLLQQGWSGVMIEGQADRFEVLSKLATKYPGKLFTVCTYVGYENSSNTLDSILADIPIPHNFEILSIDIDSYDYHVWKSVGTYRPRLVIIEIDSSTLPGEYYIYDGSGRLTSFSAMLELARKKKYTLVCHTGNMFFVADEYLKYLEINSIFIENPDMLFIDDWVNPSWLDVYKRKLKNMTWQRAIVKIQDLLRRL